MLTKVSLVAEQSGSIQEDVGGMRKTLDVHTEIIGKLVVDIEIIKEDIEFVKSGFKKKVDVEEFAAYGSMYLPQTLLPYARSI